MNDITYTTNGDYLIPDLTLPEEPEVNFGKYGRMRKQYLKPRTYDYVCQRSAIEVFKDLEQELKDTGKYPA